MTRRISEIAALLLLLLLHAGICLANPTITVGFASATPGSTVTVPVTLDNATDILIGSIMIDINFDQTRLSYIGCVLSDGTTACDPEADGVSVDTSASASGSIRFSKFTLAYPLPIIYPGVLAQLIFKIEPVVPVGLMTLQNSYYQILDTEINEIPATDINLVNGTITIPDTTAPTIATPLLPASYTNATVPVTFSATDDVGVTNYCLTEASTPTGCSWSDAVQTSYTFSGIPLLVPTQKTLYAFAKDAAGNIGTASASVTITIPDTTPPEVTAFSGPTTSSTFAVSGIALIATDNLAVTGYCLSEESNYDSCVWSATPPTMYTFKNVTQGVLIDKTLYAWAMDAAGNKSSATITIAFWIPLKVLIVAIEGNGTINSDYDILCNDVSCIKGFQADTVVTLMPTPDISSIFTGWSGACTNTSGNCVLTMTEDKNVKATFQLTPPVCTNYPASCYQTLQDAYDNATDGAVIRLKTGALTGTLLATRPIAVTLEGGYDAGYTAIAGETIFDGYVKVRSGKVSMRKVFVK